MANTITADEIPELHRLCRHVPAGSSAIWNPPELVADVNLAVPEHNPKLHEQLANADELARLNVERHGAIRVGTAEELATCVACLPLARGMYLVSYYDLVAGWVPVPPPHFARSMTRWRWRVTRFAFHLIAAP